MKMLRERKNEEGLVGTALLVLPVVEAAHGNGKNPQEDESHDKTDKGKCCLIHHFSSSLSGGVISKPTPEMITPAPNPNKVFHLNPKVRILPITTIVKTYLATSNATFPSSILRVRSLITTIRYHIDIIKINIFILINKIMFPALVRVNRREGKREDKR